MIEISLGRGSNKESAMSYRSIALRASILMATLAVAVFAFTMTKPAHRADAPAFCPRW